MRSEARSVRNLHQKQFIKLIDSLCGSFSRWSVWQDFVTFSAISISNAVDHDRERVEKREKTYLAISRKYKPEDMNTFAEMFAEVVLGIEETPEMDFLGELFMVLGLSSDAAGQFFTPYHLCEAMAKMTNPDSKMSHGWMSVNYPACGAGATLIAFANECRHEGINFQTDVLFVAQDIDMIVAMMCYIQLSLRGCPGYVVVGDSLSNPSTAHDKRGLFPVESENIWFTPMYYSPIWEFRRRIYLLDTLLHKAPQKDIPNEPTSTENTIEAVKAELTFFPDDDSQPQPSNFIKTAVKARRREKQINPDLPSDGYQMQFCFNDDL